MSTQYHSKEQTKEHTKEHTTDIKDHSSEHQHFKEHYTANQGKTDVVVERIECEPIIVEHHHHHTHTVIHPEVVREHDTTEIRQIIKPVYEHVKTATEEEYAGKHVKVIEKTEDVAEAKRKLDTHHKEMLAKADVTHTEHETQTIKDTKVKDVHAAHKVIEEVTPVIVRDVEHNKTIHKDEKLVEKIVHAPEIHKEELDVVHKEGHTMETHGLEGHTKDTYGHKEGHTKDTHIHKEGHTKDTHGLKEGHTKDTTGIKEGHTKDTHGVKVHKDKHGVKTKGHSKDKTVKEGHTKEMTGKKEEHAKEKKVMKDEVPTHHVDARPDH
jgi:hypothetical protein